MLPGIPGIYTTKQLAYSLSACVGFFTFHSSPFVFIVVTCTFQFNSWKASFPQWSSGQAVVTGGALFLPPPVGSIHFAFIPTARRFMHTSWGSIHSASIPTACRFMHAYDTWGSIHFAFIPTARRSFDRFFLADSRFRALTLGGDRVEIKLFRSALSRFLYTPEYM